MIDRHVLYKNEIWKNSQKGKEDKGKQRLEKANNRRR